MRSKTILRGLALACVIGGAAQAQVAPVGVSQAEQLELLKSPDPKLAANKKLVFDAWRAVVQGGHAELAERYFTADYIQHNPNVATGRDAMVAYMRQTRPVRAIPDFITFPVITMTAERDIVTLATVAYDDDPTNPGKRYAYTHFDMFRIQDGKIAEHWDSLPKNPALLHTDPNVANRP